jgi:hypothetical protein
MPRTFEWNPAVRERVPVLVGLSSASGGGKTFSALRLATGMQRVVGGKIAMIDTENRRGLHYADLFDYHHVPLAEPFGSLDYLAAIQHCDKMEATITIIDSASHEHEGVGGLLDLHEQELGRLAKNDRERETKKFLAWQKPKAHHRKLMNAIARLGGNYIFCFRAKTATKPVKVKGKTEFVQQGWLPIASPDLVYEQTVNILLPPASGGVPQWETEYAGERQMMKLPMQFKELFKEPRQLDEDIGQALAEWAQGGAEPAKKDEPAPPQDAEGALTVDDRRAISEASFNAAHALLNAASLGECPAPKRETEEALAEEIRDAAFLFLQLTRETVRREHLESLAFAIKNARIGPDGLVYIPATEEL